MRKRLYFQPPTADLCYGINHRRIITLEVWIGSRSPRRTLSGILRRICARENLTERETYRVVYALLGSYNGLHGVQLTAEGTVAGFYDLGACRDLAEAHRQLALGGPLLAQPVQRHAADRARTEARRRYRQRVPYQRTAVNLPF